MRFWCGADWGEGSEGCGGEREKRKERRDGDVGSGAAYAGGTVEEDWGRGGGGGGEGGVEVSGRSDEVD